MKYVNVVMFCYGYTQPHRRHQKNVGLEPVGLVVEEPVQLGQVVTLACFVACARQVRIYEPRRSVTCCLLQVRWHR